VTSGVVHAPDIPVAPSTLGPTVRATFTLADATGGLRYLTAEWAGPATLGHLLGAARCALPRPDAAIAVDGHHFGPATLIDLTGVRDGSVVSLSAAYGTATAPTDPSAQLHLAVVNGWEAGTIVPLQAGTTRVGRFPDCEVVLVDPAVSGQHLAIHVGGGEVVVEDIGSSNGTTLDGAPLKGRTSLVPGQRVRVGDTILEVRPPAPADAVVHPHAGAYELRRPPRLLRPRLDAVVTWPAEPTPPGRQIFPIASAAAPIVMGGVLYFVLHDVIVLLMIGLSPIMMAVNTMTSRRGGKARYRVNLAEYEAELVQVNEELTARIATECVLRRDASPDPATVGALAAGPRRRLWERRRSHEDFLELRLGLADLPSTVRRVQASAFANQSLEPAVAPTVPAVISLAETGILGLSGPSGPVTATASSLVAQLACFSGPSDVQIVVLAGDRPDAESRWGWTRWLPHLRSVDPSGPVAIGTTPETVTGRVSEIVELIEHRRAAAEDHRGRLQSTDWARIVVVLDPAYDLRRIGGVDVILKYGPGVDVFALCIEDAESYLPPECRAVLAVDERGTAVLHQSGQPDVAPIALDLVTPAWAETLARRLAPLRDPEAVTSGGTIPTSVRLVDLLDFETLDADAVLGKWRAEGRTTSAIVGVGLDGPIRLDLKADGPHGLVAGTTGAGKSEFLQTLVAALATGNRHDALNFLLVDYKGGSAFRGCADLPHTVGVVTDLDGHLTERALASLAAELKRREELLAKGGAKDIDDYVDMGEPAGSLPRLLIVIDEFAGLVAELPEFVHGLVGIAQRGRSLGIHLILATQRPSGVVSPEIRANTNLRVALRVTSPAESVDIIDAPEAARITPATPGRAYAMTGHSALTAFQSARVGGRAAPAETQQGPEVALVDMPWSMAGRVARLARVGAGGEIDPADTDLARLVDVLTEAAARSGIPRQPRPWLPPLPTVLPLGPLLDDSPPVAGALRAVPIGVVDLPDEQRQERVWYDVESARHLLIGGSAGSGRTMTLRTLAVSLASGLHPDDLWLYAIDCGGGELRRLVDLPHCGAVVTRTEQDRAVRLLTRLHAEMSRRLEGLAEAGYADVAEQRASAEPGERLPYIVVLLDRWEGFMSTFDPVDGGHLTDLFLDVAREGGAAGIRLVVTGDRSALIGRMPSMIDERICLNLADRNEYSVAGFDARKVPTPMAEGRAVRTPDTAEMQIAVAGAGVSGTEQSAALGELVARWRAVPASAEERRPFRVDPLPNEIDSLTMDRHLKERPESPHWAVLGLGGDELAAIGVDLHQAGGFVIAGPRRSGRSTTLLSMAESLLAGGCSVLAFCPRVSPLRSLKGRAGVVAVIEGDDPSINEALAVVNQAQGPMVVFVDDAPLLYGASVAELLENIAREGPEMGHVMVIAGTADELMRPMRGFIYNTCQSRAGLMLCPENHTQGELFGVRLARSMVFRGPAGRGVFIDGGDMRLVQVPLPA
jgi:DNA segregation ATPase FtsK/SpoIIIE, S-DNA-T family